MMVMTNIPLYKHGHGQTIVKRWSYHGQPWSRTMIDHGQTTADHNPVTGEGMICPYVISIPPDSQEHALTLPVQRGGLG